MCASTAVTAPAAADICHATAAAAKGHGSVRRAAIADIQSTAA